MSEPSLATAERLRTRYGGLRAAMLMHPTAHRTVGPTLEESADSERVVPEHVTALSRHAPRLIKESW